MEGTSPLPTEGDGESDSGILSHYVVRLTSHGKFIMDQLEAFLKEEAEITQYVIGRETVPQEHFHVVLTIDPSFNEQDVRDIIKAFLVPLWAKEDGKLPRGFGNKQYNLQISEDLDRAVSYAVKLGEYVYDGFTEEYIISRKAESFEKKKPSNFKSEYIDLCDLFYESRMDTREFMVAYISLKAKYGQSVRMSDAYGYALSNLFKREPESIEGFVEDFLYKQ